MEKNINYKKKMARLRYQDEILKLHFQNISIREITKIVNSKLARTDLKVSLSKSTIGNIIKKRKKNDIQT